MTTDSTLLSALPDPEPIYKRNFFLFLTDSVLFTVAMGIISPTTVIPDFIRHLTASEIVIGLAASLFDVGKNLPQLFIARYIIQFERKKWWFAGPNIPVRFVMLIFAGIIVLLGKDRPNAILAAFLICYGIVAVGDGVVSVPWADLAGSSMSNRWRARMFGLLAAITSILMLGIAPLVGLALGAAGPGFPNNYAILFAAAGGFFALSILPTLFIHEMPGSKAVEKIPTLGEYLPSLGRVLRQDAPFRWMVIIRTLTGFFAMAAPFYIGFATVQLGMSSTIAVPTLLAVQIIGSVAGALIYAWMGGRHNVLFMRLALGAAALLPICALLAAVLGPLPLYVGFLIFGLTLSNLFLSYYNWLLSYAPTDQRPIYAGLYNTISAVVSLIAPIIAGAVVQVAGYEPLFMIALTMALGALFVTVRYLPMAQNR